MASSWRLIACTEIDILATSVERMAAGNLGASIPPVAKSLAPLSEALENLKKNFATQWHDLSTERSTLDSTLNSLPDAVLLFDNNALTFFNHAAGEMFGIRSHQLHGDLSNLGFPAPVEALIAEAISQTSHVSVDLEADPLGRSLKVSSIPVSITRTQTTTLITVSNITERVLLDKMRKDFVAAASHELKTPVAGIELISETALLALEDSDIKTAIEFITSLRREAANMRRLVGDLLNLSRYETGISEHEVGDIRAAVHNATISHTLAAQKRGLDLILDFSAIGSEDVFAAAAPTDIAIILDNLVDNAIAYTDSGEVLVSVECVDDMVQIEVSDSGLGIPPAELPRIFERFYRIDPSRSRESGGTGLGLALVKHAVERVQGTIEVESTVGDGSRFTVSIPRAH